MAVSARRRVASNTALQLAGKGALLAMGAVSIAVLTRYLGPERYGQYTLALMYMQLFAVLADGIVGDTRHVAQGGVDLFFGGFRRPLERKLLGSRRKLRFLQFQ